MKKLLLTITALSALTIGAHAQILYTSGNYTQNFDTLATTGNTNVWTDNVTLLGWYAAGTFGGNYTGSTGSSNAGDLYSFGVAGVNPLEERALGSIASSTTGTLNYGLRLTNNNAFTLTSFTLTYDGEQWRRGDNANQRPESLRVDYQIFSPSTGSLTAPSGWTAVSALTFTSPNATLSSASALDGNAAGNRTAGITSTVSLTWNSGDELWLRWSDPNDPGTDHGMAIDNVVFSAIPEPVSLSLLGVGGAIAFILRRRRR